MASAALATATMAAAGFDKRASTSSSFLTTPGSSTFPSELRSPGIGSPGFLKREADLGTPITPPSAYLDFLKNMSPAMLSPAPTSACMRVSFGDRPFERDSESADGKKSLSIAVPASQPSLSRNTSYDSNSSLSSEQSLASSVTTQSSAARSRVRPESPRVIIPGSPFAKPGPRSARTPRRLHIPQSPFSPNKHNSQSLASPYSSTPLSATPWSATFGPREGESWDANAKPGKVCVRQVITRTVTYCRTPLEPAPKGKRRKIEVEPPTPIAKTVDIKLEDSLPSKLPSPQSQVVTADARPASLDKTELAPVEPVASAVDSNPETKPVTVMAEAVPPRLDCTPTSLAA